jgi:hypothetical protein
LETRAHARHGGAETVAQKQAAAVTKLCVAAHQVAFHGNIFRDKRFGFVLMFCA